MRNRLTGRLSLLILSFAVALLVFPAVAFAETIAPDGTTSLSPTITSDKEDYPPGGLVTLTGSNWQPGESVHIYVNDDQGKTWSRDADVTADASGNISDSFNLPDWFVATYSVTATGAQSGVATSSFTDGNMRFGTSTAAVEFDASWTRFNSSTNCTGAQGTRTNGTGTVENSAGQTLQVGVDQGQSIQLTAPATEDGHTFSSWSGPPGTFTVSNNGQTICVVGATFNGNRLYVANYAPTPTNTAPVANNDSATTNEDNAINGINVLGNDTDAQGNTLSVSSFTQPTNGTVTKNADNTLKYVPNANFNGTDTFTYKANDGTVDSSNSATVTITVNSVNDAPSFTKGADQTVNEDASAQTVTGWATAISSGAANESTQTVSFTTTNNNNSLFSAQPQVSSNGTLTYTPAANASGTATVTVTAKDTGGTANGGVDTSASQTFTITINSVNDAPVANNDSATTNEDTATDIAVLTNDTDPEGNTLSVSSFTQPSNGTVTQNADGTLKYTPAANYNGSDSFTYKAKDASADSNVATVSLTVTSVNDAPVAKADAKTTDEDKALTFPSSDLLTNDDKGAANESTQTLTVTEVSGATNGTVSLQNGNITFTPAANFNGAASFDYTVCDNGSPSQCSVQTATVNVTVNAVNDAPVAVNDSKTTNEDTATDINVVANDTDEEGDALSVSSFTQPANGQVTQNADGTLKYTPAADYNGPDSFTYKAKDADLDSNVATVSLTVNAVNDAPVAKDDSATTNEDTAANGNVLTNDTDVDSANLTATKVSDPAHGTLTFNANGSYTYTPAADYNGSDSFTYKANDGSLDSNVATVSITVNAVNDAPVGTDDSYTTIEDTDLTVSAANGLLKNDTDIENDTLHVDDANATATGINPVSGPSHGTLTLNADGSFTYKPNLDYNGSDSFTYRVCDNGSPQKCSVETANVNIKIDPVNDAPVAKDDTATSDEDTAKDINVITNDTDVDNTNAELSVSSFTQPSHGQVTQNADGTLKYNPEANYNGPDSFTYKAKDPGNAESAPATVSITVTAVNDAPVATPDTKTTDEDTPLTFPSSDLVGNDNKGAANESAQTLTVKEVFNGTHGTVSLGTDGNITFTPEADFSGTATFDYRVCDNGSPSECSVETAKVNVTVSAVNDAPVAKDDTLTTNEDTPNNVNVITNDTDVDNTNLSVSSYTQPAHGTVSQNADGTLRYTPANNYNGPDSFTYKAKDPDNADSNVATVNVTVNAVNDAPVAAADTNTTAEDTAANGNVLTNDTDVDGDSLSAALATQAAHGSATVNANGSYTYTPNANYNGPDSFTYTVSDGHGGTATGQVSITVSPVNDAPTVTLSGAAIADEGQTKTYTFAVSDPDSGDTFTVKSGFPDCGTGGVQVGQTSTTATGGSFNCSFPDGPASPIVRIQVTDGHAVDSNTATQGVAVANVNPTIGPLTVTGNTGTACIGSSNVVKLSFSITDPGVDTHSGTINWGDGTTTTFNGSSVTDAQHSYSAGTYNITVNASDGDVGGNAAPKSTTTANQVSLLYKVSKFTDPVNLDGTSVFKSGSTIPLKVLITDCNNQPVSGLVPRISFTKIDPSTPALGVNEGLSTQPNDTNFLMRDAGNGQYIYNLSSKSLPDQDAKYNATITDSKATQTAPATYGPMTSQNFGIRTK